MKKFLAMLPLVAVLAGCSASMRSGASVHVVREPSVFPAYSGSFAGYGCLLPPLHAWIGLGWMNPFRYYGFYMHYCSLYGAGDFSYEDTYDYGPVRSSPVVGPGIMKVQPTDVQRKTRSVYAAQVSINKPALRPDRESRRQVGMSPAPGSGGEKVSRDRDLPESRTAALRGEIGSGSRKKK